MFEKVDRYLKQNPASLSMKFLILAVLGLANKYLNKNEPIDWVIAPGEIPTWDMPKICLKVEYQGLSKTGNLKFSICETDYKPVKWTRVVIREDIFQ